MPPLSAFTENTETAQAATIDLKRVDEKDGYILDAILYEREHGGSGTLKTTPNGHTVLIPQPSSDPHDPLNWSKWKKNTCLLIISLASFLPDCESASGAITNLVQPA